MKSVMFENLSINLLKTFCVFAETGKVEESAQKLRVTQASVSLQLKKLEEETGQILFKTVGRKKLLTTFARDLFHSIAPPLRELDNRLKEVSKTSVRPEQRMLRIGCRFEIIKRITPLIKFPGQVHISGMTSAEAERALKNDEIDVALLPNPKIKGDWYSKKVFTDHPILIANPKILKARSWETITTQLFKSPAVAYKNPPPYLEQIVEKLGGKPTDLRIKLYCQDWTSIIDVVKSSASWSVLPLNYKNQLDELTIIEIPSRIHEPSNIYAVYSREWRGVPILNP